MPIFSDLSLYYCGSSSSLPPSYYSNQYSALNPSIPSYTSPRSGGFSGFSSGLPFSNPPPRLLPTPPRITKYSPLLPSISESTSLSALPRRPLPRISSPRGAPIYRPPKPIDIDTADIDVTTPRKRIDRISRDRDDPQQGTIKRGRTVVRLHTRRLKENPGLVQNRRKTPGEKLVEKFLIKDKASEEAKRIKLEKEASRLNDVYKETASPEAGAQSQAEVVENVEICNHRRKSIQDCLIELEGLIDFYEPEQTFLPGKEEQVGEERQDGREEITSEVLDRLLPEKVNEPVEAPKKLDEVQMQEPEPLPNVENSICKQVSVKEKQKKSAEKSSTVKKRPKKRDKKSTVKKVDKKVFEKKETPIEKSLLQRRNTVKKLRRNSRDVEQLTLDLNSGTSTCEGTTIPTSPVSSTPDTSIASTPTSSVPSTPVGSIPTTPAGSIPSTPGNSKIFTTVTSLSSTPKSSKQSTPIGSTLSTPVASSPTTPINSRPSTPTSPFAIKTEPSPLIEKRKPVVPKSQSSDRDIFPFKTKNNEVKAESKFPKKICVDVSVENAEDLLKKSPLKFVVDEIKVEETPKSPKSPKLFRYEVTVEEVAERQPFQKQKSVAQTCETLSNKSDALNTLKNIIEENEADVEFWNTEDAEVHKIYKRIKNISKINERERDIKNDIKDCNFTPESTENTFHVTKKQSHDQLEPLKHTENKLTKENVVQNLKLPNTKQIPSKKQIQSNRKVQEIDVKQKEIRSISNLITMEKKVNETNLQKDSESEILKDKIKLKILNGILAMETPKFPVFTQFISKTEDVKVGKDLDDNILATYSTWGERLNDSSIQTRKTIEDPKYTMEADDKVTSLKNADVASSKNITESGNISTKKKTEPLTTLPKLAAKSSSYDQQKKEDAVKKNILLLPKKEKVTNDNASLTEPVIKNEMLGPLQTMKSIEKVEEKSKVHSTLNIETLKEAEKISITSQNEAISVVAKKDEQDIPAWKKALIAKAQANKKSQEPPDHQQKSEQAKQNLKFPTATRTDLLPSASCTSTESSSASQSEIVLPTKSSPDSPLKLKQNPVPETIKTLPDKPKLRSSMEINQTVPETSTSEDKRQKQDLFSLGKTSKDVGKTISEKLTTENADEICSKGSSSDLKSVQNISDITSTDKSKTDGRNAKLSEKSVEIVDIKLLDNNTDKSSTLGKQRQFENNSVDYKQNNLEVKEETKDVQPKLSDGKLKLSDKPPVVKKKVFEDKLLESKPKPTEIKPKEKTKPTEIKAVNTQLVSSEKQPVEKVKTKEATDLAGKQRSSKGKSKPADLKLVNTKTKSPEISPTEKSKSSVAKVAGNSEKTKSVGKENHSDLKSADNKINVSEISPTDKIKSTEKRSLGRKPKPTGQISVEKSTFNETKPEVKSTPSETSPTEIAVTTDKGLPGETSVEKGKIKVKVAESKPSKSDLETSLNKTTATDKLDTRKCESGKEKSIPKLTAEKTSTIGKEVVQIKSDMQDKTRKFGREILGQEKPSETVAVLKSKAEATPIAEEISVSSSGSTTVDPKTDETQKDEVQQVSTTDEKDASSSEEETESEEETDTDDDGEEVKPTPQRASTSSSEDSGFDSLPTSVPGSPACNKKGPNNKDCDVNCHKKCEKLMPHLCGVNQKLIVEALTSLKKGASTSSSSSTDTATSSTALLSSNPALGLDPYEDPSPPSTLVRGGRVTPPATTIPRFRKYVVEDFQFLKVLGKGSFGKVLLAELKGTECYYAVKCLKKDVVLEDDDVECTLIERKVLALGTKHPYLCHLFCTFQTESHLFFVMEYLNGGDLMFHIQQSGRFQEPRARFYAAEIVSGLKFLHKKGVVYRDLKLDNILLDFDGHVRIADFGMCKLQIYLDRTADTFCGTPDYMAPEIIKGLKYNQCVDWWSFGILLYEMLIGQSPFSGCDEDDLFWSICNEQPHFPRFLSREASSILSLLLEKDSSKRLGTTECMAGDVTNQPFFRNVDWDALERRELEPPFKPRVQHPLDVQYFDKAFTVERAKLTPVEREILQSMDQTQFQGFSYTNPNATD